MKTLNQNKEGALDCLIIGGGISGIAMAYQAKMHNIRYKLVDKEDSYGGVWYQNNYPKLTTDSVEPLYNYKVDVPAFGSLSTGAKSPEQVREYLGNFIKKFDLESDFHYSTKVESSSYNGTHYITNTTNGVFHSKYLVIAVGINGLDGFNTQKIPQFQQLDEFQGQVIHSSDLSSNYDVVGKNVCIIGNGPTSIQLVESFAPQAEYLTQICRTPRQIMKKPSFDKICELLERFSIDRNDEEAIFNFLDNFFHTHVFTGFSEENKQLKLAYGDMLSGNNEDMYHSLFPLSESEQEFVDYMRERDLIPEWKSGYTNLRQLFIDTYDKEVLRDNVDLVKSQGIDYFTPEGVVTKEGKEVNCNLVVCATGSTKIVDFPHFHLYDENGEALSGDAEKISENYWGIMNKNYPNMFYLLGPGSAGVQNVPPLVEIQSKVIAKIIAAAEFKNAKTVTVNEESFNSYNEEQVVKRNKLKELQASEDSFGDMNNHQYHKGLNLHEFIGGTLEYRNQLESFSNDSDIINVMGLDVESYDSYDVCSIF